MLLLFLRQWPVSRCLEAFDVMTRRVFRQKQEYNRSLFGGFRHIIRCWLADGYYNVTALEDCLKETFGTQQRMLDFSDVTSGTKVAVTASNISDASTYVFSNYNGTGTRHSDCG